MSLILPKKYKTEKFTHAVNNNVVVRRPCMQFNEQQISKTKVFISMSNTRPHVCTHCHFVWTPVLQPLPASHDRALPCFICFNCLLI